MSMGHRAWALGVLLQRPVAVLIASLPLRRDCCVHRVQLALSALATATRMSANILLLSVFSSNMHASWNQVLAMRICKQNSICCRLNPTVFLPFFNFVMLTLLSVPCHLSRCGMQNTAMGAETNAVERIIHFALENVV